MEKRTVQFLMVLLISFMSSIKADFLDLCGMIAWHGDSKAFCSMFREALSSGKYSSEEIFDIDLKLNADNGSYGQFQGWTLLMIAAHTGNYEITKELLESGADVWLKNSEGKTAIGIANDLGHKSVVELIAEYSKPKSLVKQMLDLTISNLRQKEDKEEAINGYNSTLPKDLLEMLKDLLLIDKDEEMRSLGLLLIYLNEIEHSS